MLLKWMICDVTDPVRFAAGQAGWSALREVPGFVGQAGGWSTTVPGRAHILAHWRDRAAHDAFMATGHDAIATGQAGTYRHIEIRFREDGTMPPVEPIALVAAWTVGCGVSIPSAG